MNAQYRLYYMLVEDMRLRGYLSMTEYAEAHGYTAEWARDQAKRGKIKTVVVDKRGEQLSEFKRTGQRSYRFVVPDGDNEQVPILVWPAPGMVTLNGARYHVESGKRLNIWPRC